MASSFGLKLAPQRTTIEELRGVWKVADDGGFDHVWNFDHFGALGDDRTGDVFESWTLLGAMAEATTRVRLGCMVTGNTLRHPAVLAKMAVTVDHLSGGRLEFGLGAGRLDLEHEMFSLPYPGAGERIARLDEACELIRALWTQDDVNYSGTYYALNGAVANPKPLQRQGPPIWIGGSGRKKTLRVVARWADVWNAPGDDIASATELSRVLDDHCGEIGRDPAEIRRSVQFPLPNDQGELDDKVAAYVSSGFRDFIFSLTPGTAIRDAERGTSWLKNLRVIA